VDWRELLKLSGILIVLVGLALRMRTTIVVVAAALVTGLVAGLPLFTNEGLLLDVPLLTKPVAADAARPPEGIINMLGRAFADYRLMTLFILTLPAIGLAERYGLQEQSAALIRRISAATVGRLEIVYQLLRVLIGIMGVRVNGHASFVRPLIFPMSMGAAEAMMNKKSVEDVPPQVVEEIKASNAASENYGNFYGQNLSPVQAGILLVAATLAGLNHHVNLLHLVYYTIPIVVLSILFAAIQFLHFDRRIRRKADRD
jgi:uncharacterized membrane protein